jgi:hypothetical protein
VGLDKSSFYLYAITVIYMFLKYLNSLFTSWLVNKFHKQIERKMQKQHKKYSIYGYRRWFINNPPGHVDDMNNNLSLFIWLYSIDILWVINAHFVSEVLQVTHKTQTNTALNYNNAIYYYIITFWKGIRKWWSWSKSKRHQTLGFC